MVAKNKPQQFVLLPARGLRAEGRTATEAARSFLIESDNQLKAATTRRGAPFAAVANFTAPDAPKVKMRVLDSIAEDGAKLVELSPAEALALREHQPELKLAPIIYYHPQIVPPKTVKSKFSTAAAALKIKLTVVSKKDGKGVAGAMVVAFTDFANRIGAQGKTNSKGEVNLALGGLSKKLQRLYVYPGKNFWGALKKNITVNSTTKIGLDSIDLSFTDSLRFFYGNSPDNAGERVKVAVVDSGIALDHPDLRVVGGVNTVQGEEANDFGNSDAEGHGTHVAGIIAARGKPPTGIRGLAPAAALFSCRVFGATGDGASNFDIAKAIDLAVRENCDLINMSLGGSEPDDVLKAAMEDALAKGSLVIVAAGNDDRSPVSFPASASPPAIAVSALGRKGTFPAATTQEDTVAAPFGTDKKNFIASFSNFGIEIDLTAPGVGVISTVPGGYAPMDGTSMACPAVTGFAARLLSGKQDILDMPRDPNRSKAMAQALLQAAKTLGFEPQFQGQGMPK